MKASYKKTKGVVKFTILLILLTVTAVSFSQTQKDCSERIKLGIELLSKEEYQESLEVLTLCLEEAKLNNWYHEIFMATNNIGSNYYSLGDLNEATIYFLKAFQIAEEYLDKTSQMTCINNIGVVYFQDRDFIKAQQFFEKAYSLAEELKSKEKQGLYALNLALVNNKIKNLDEAWIYIEKSKYLLTRNPSLMVRLNLAKAEWHILKGEFDVAKASLLNMSPEIEENKFNEDKMFQHILLSDIYAQEGKFDFALKHALVTREITTGMENLINYYNVLSNIYTKQNNYYLALTYKDSVIIYKDSLFTAKIDESFQQNKIKFQVLVYQQELRESKLEASKNMVLFYSILFITLLILLFGVFLFKNYKDKEQQKKELTDLELSKKESERLLLEKQLMAKETMVLLNREKHKNEMDAKNRELLGKAFVQSSQNEAIKELVKIMENQQNMLKLEDVHQAIGQLKQLLKDKNHWQNFFLHFEKTNPGFIQRLTDRHPNLTANEVRFVTYIYINLSNKEIASLLNISYSSVRKRKERFAQKIGLTSTSELYNYLLDI